MSTHVSESFVAALRDASVFAPELPESAATDVYELVRDYERAIVSPPSDLDNDPKLADYTIGSATSPDELRIVNPKATSLLVSAEHATDPRRKGKNGGPDVIGGADHGTGGLAAYLAVERGLTALIAAGRQTTTINTPLKYAIDDMLPGRTGFLSIHGMAPGKLEDLSDPTEIHGLIGLGQKPSELSRTVAEELVKRARDFGLRVGIGNDIEHRIQDPQTNGFKLDTMTGEVKRGRLAALAPSTTTNRANAIIEPQSLEIPAFQIELTRLLRLIPADLEDGWHGDEKARAMGVYLGYLLVADASVLMQAYC